MANLEHVEQLKRGVDNWNIWRTQNKALNLDRKVDLSGVDLTGADLKGADLYGADLSGANLQEADLSNVLLSGADLSRANLQGADLKNTYLTGANLSEANLANANLSKAYLVNANLYLANLHHAELLEVYLGGANLRGAYLSGAYLSGANLNRTDLSGANLNGANLSGANLNRSDLNGADLSRAKMSNTTIAKINLSTTKGLSTIDHEGPSHVELFSIRLPQDGSALQFLRGTGVPDEWIDDYRAHMMHPIQYHSCFISYCKADEILANRLYADLQAEGVRCWFAPKDMKIGDRIHRRIDEAIHLQDKLLLLLSKSAMVSDWVESEVLTALEKEQKQGRDVLFPIRLDNSVQGATQPWVKHMRLKRHIADFTRWARPQAYQEAFTRLLRDLKQN